MTSSQLLRPTSREKFHVGKPNLGTHAPTIAKAGVYVYGGGSKEMVMTLTEHKWPTTRAVGDLSGLTEGVICAKP